MANKNNPTHVVTGRVRFSYEHLMKPYANTTNDPNAEPKYSVTVLLPKSDKATKARLDAGIEAAKKRGIDQKRYKDGTPIIIAIRNQSGIDLSYRRKEPFHWWEFLLEFHTLAGEHYITNLMAARGYKGKDRDMLKRKYALALPEEMSKDEEDELAAFNEMMGSGWEEDA